MEKDLEHLKLLGIFHYIWGALACVVGLIGVVYVLIGIVALNSPASSSEDSASPAVLGGIFIGIGIFLFLVCEIYGILTIMAGGKYRKHQGGYWFCFVLAVITCLNVPIGTVLGVFSIMVLNRPTVKALFRGEALPATPLGTPPVS